MLSLCPSDRMPEVVTFKGGRFILNHEFRGFSMAGYCFGVHAVPIIKNTIGGNDVHLVGKKTRWRVIAILTPLPLPLLISATLWWQGLDAWHFRGHPNIIITSAHGVVYNTDYTGK